MNLHAKKIALVHDYLLRIGGAERVLKVLHEMFPQASIYTVVYDEKFVETFFEDGARVRATFLQKLPRFLRYNYKFFSPLIPSAVERLDLSEFDVVISSCSAFCKGVITRPDTVHICYCHTPTRFLWDWTHEVKGGTLANILFHFLRFWDRQAAGRVDYFIANSRHVAERIRKYYGRRDVKVIYPPALLPSNLPAGQAGSPESNYSPSSYFLIVSQLRSYKQIDIAIDAFRKLGFPLVIIGQGNDEKRLKKFARGARNIHFLGYQPDDVVSSYYAHCKAFIFPGEDDFGMTMIEAMSFGKPVLALRKGGAKEIVVEGMIGEFFDDPHPVVLADGLRRLLENYQNYSPFLIKKRAEKFSRERFATQLLEFIKERCKI